MEQRNNMKRFKELFEDVLTEIETKRIAGKEYRYYYDKYNIFVLDENDEIMGFGDVVYLGEDFGDERIYVVGNVLGYGFGDLIYGAASAHFGKLLPTGNESDLCKRGWKKRFDGSESSKWNKWKVEGLGKYDVSEDYMNYVYELKDKSSFDVKDVNTLPNKDSLIIKHLGKETELRNIVMGGMGKLYTIGKSGFASLRKGTDIHEIGIPYVTELLKALKTSLGDKNILKGLSLDSSDKVIELYNKEISIEYVDGKKIHLRNELNKKLIELELVGI